MTVCRHLHKKLDFAILESFVQAWSSFWIIGIIFMSFFCLYDYTLLNKLWFITCPEKKWRVLWLSHWNNYILLLFFLQFPSSIRVFMLGIFPKYFESAITSFLSISSIFHKCYISKTRNWLSKVNILYKSLGIRNSNFHLGFNFHHRRVKS